MKATDLRIGNLVKINNRLLIETEGEIYKVSGFNSRYDILFSNSTGVVSLDHTKTIKTYSQFDEFIEPIPLTEEWLIMLGFACDEFNGNQSKFKVYSKGLLTYNTGHGWWFCNKRLDNQPLFVHRLQNLYYELHNEELIIK